jgi:hypothetical protein
MGQIWPGNPAEVKNLLNLPQTYHQLLIDLSWPQPTNYTITALHFKSVLSYIYVSYCKRVFLQQPLLV